jgi:transposase InsO family protein
LFVVWGLDLVGPL